MLNQLTRNRQLARTSKTPGRTQLLNFFTTSLGGRLVDLPGYGYARVAKSQKHVWEDNVEAYLAQRGDLVALVLVMDVRRPFEPFDVMMIEWAQRAELPMHVLLNKADKLKHGAQTVALRDAKKRLDLAIVHGAALLGADRTWTRRGDRHAHSLADTAR